MKPIIIAGPCSAESREQVLYCAKALKEIGADAFRAGIWKPRTHPGAFEGIGEAGLEWLAEASRETGLPACTEVASTRHIEKCLDAGIRTMWIGARTTTNPILIQELADCLSGTGVKLWIKNPVSPDLELWAGAVERFQRSGISDLGLIHRGFTSLNAAPYRNSPMWSLAVCMKTRFPELPFVCDPSHMAGDRAYIKEIAQRSLDIGFDGLMMEVHPNPDCAKSDARQQLTPEDLQKLLECLVLRDGSSPSNPDADIRLEELRGKIDLIDEKLLELLSSRMEVSRRIGEIKAGTGMQIIQPERWDEVMARVLAEASAQNLSRDLVESIYELIHGASVSEQKY